MTLIAFHTIVAVIAVSAISFVGLTLFLVRADMVKRALLFFVSFSAGALLGDVFLHILPELNEAGTLEQAIPIILGGIVVSFIVEKVIHWRHCHIFPSEHHYHPVGTLSLIGDGIHNFLDGILIAGSFLIDPAVGVATTIAVALHEIPQEIGDFALLLYSGYERKKALLWNFFSACMAIVGAVLVLLTAGKIPNLEQWILPFAAGNFLYIAGADLIPELHKESRLPHAFLQLVCLIAGIGVMFALTFAE